VSWDVDPSVVAGRQSESSLAEQYRAVRTWLLVRSQNAKHSALAITSSVPREGKSVTTANLAIVMTEVRRLRVLVVDGDMRQGSLARLLRIEQSPGLADVLAGRAELDGAIIRSPIRNLDILPAGHCAGINPTELLNSASAARSFGEIRDRYHVCLVDTPPVQRVSDVGVIGPLCSGVLFVVRMHRTASHLVRQSLHWLQSNNLNVMGCIATACSQRDTIYTYRPGLDGA
jgi:capsular exopolysaccharide synthesis family protein